MSLPTIFAALDNEIEMWQQARDLLSGEPSKRKRGRPKSVVSHTVAKKRNLTLGGRERIAEAVGKRWAAQKKSAAE